MAEMVWCQSCKTVVWAYDHQSKVDLRGICNMLKLPCPKCGDTGNFDGWASNNSHIFLQLRGTKEEPIYDWWSAMRFIAKQNGVEWGPSPDNTWFKRPEMTPGDYEILMDNLKGELF